MLIIAFAFAAPLFGGTPADDHNPVGVTGIFNGNVQSAGSYDPMSHSAHRAIDDIVVPNSLGKYPLKMTRYYNTRQQYYAFTAIGLSPGWAHEYSWLVWSNGTTVVSPHGATYDFNCQTPVGVSEGWEGTHSSGNGTWRLADGGRVHFSNGRADYIDDPYGLRTTITYDPGTGLRTKVTEPGGRYLSFFYNDTEPTDETKLLTRVEAHGAGDATVTDWVNYSYTLVSPGGSGAPMKMLTRVAYSDGTSATYTYRTDNVRESPTSPPYTFKIRPVLDTCDDVRYNGPMRRITYDYQNDGPHGEITDEKNPDVGGGIAVSSISPALSISPPVGDYSMPYQFTETRADGPGRTFTYTQLSYHRGIDDPPGACPDITSTGPPTQFLTSYSDFVPGHITYIGYDANWFINSVQDANGHTTTYTRGPSPYASPAGIGQITKITHTGDGTHIDYTYQPETGAIGGHYVQTVSNERQKITIYTRDPTTHLVTQIDYPSDANTPASYETFTYNAFGQVLNHRLKNGAYERVAYDSRGLLTDKWNPKQNAVPLDADPHTHYDYYTSADGNLGWIDRVKKMTLPANDVGHAVSETYEYDRALDANGITNLTGAAVGGRGLVTKIIHADNTYKQFKYDAYGNKRWEDNEMRQASSATYDNYNRLLTATNPLNKTATYTYTPTNGNGGSPYKHTTNNPDTISAPSGIVTTNVYDQNFRKTSMTVAGATTWFHYDAVGNQDYVTDPRGTSTPGAYTTYTDYDSRDRKWQIRQPLGHATQFYYDDGINITRIIRPDTTTETKSYDAMNRVLSDTVPQTLSNSLTTNFAYNPSGTIWKMTDAKGNVTTFLYDASDRKISMTYPDYSNQQWLYDNAGNLQQRITVNGETQWFYYDIRNFKYANWWSNWNDTTRNPDWCYFAYDATGRLTEAQNGISGWGSSIISDVQRFYDAAGHLVQEQQIFSGLYPVYVNYPSYDNDGRLTRMYVSGVSGYDFTYSYDTMGRFEKIFITNGAQLFQYRYDVASNEIERDNISNGVNQVYPRDALNRMQYMDVIKGATLGRETYTYDMMNRITMVSYTIGSPDSFQYYLDGELKMATLGNLGHTLTYNLDNKGNRTSVVDNNVSSSYTPNVIDQYSPTAAGSSIVNGSEHEIKTYDGVTYTYINDERLQQVSDGMNIYSLVYDALGRCVKRTLQYSGQEALRPTPTPREPPSPTPRPSATPNSGDMTTYYIYDGDKPILEYDATSGALVGSNVYGKGVDEILGRVAVGSVYYPQQNHESSVTLLTDTNGNAIERYRYDAFGAPTFYTGTWGSRSNTAYDNRFLFTGREYAATYRGTTSPAFNFYEYRARAYNPKLGRFMSEDPKLFDAGDYNLFRYCHNDPIDLTDPMGLDTVVIVGEPRDDSLSVGHASMGMTGQGVFSQGTGTLKENWGISARSFITRQSEHRQQTGYIIHSTDKQEAKMRQSLESIRDKHLPNVYRHPIDAYNDNCSTRVRDALKAAGIDIGKVHTPQQLANALEGQAKDGQVEKLPIPAKSNSVPEQLKQFEPGASSNRTDFQPPIDKKAQEHASDVIHSKPDPNPQ